MTEKILFVDDEPHVLQSIQRQLRKRFTLEIAEGGAEALRILKENGPFAVIVSDMRMPEMNGVELLSKVKDLYPDTVRMMLTGNADQETAMDAVNTGHIFRFLTKPCPPATFITSLALAQRQYRLINAEKELLQQTLRGSVSVLSELLGIANPVAFSSAGRITYYVVQVVKALNWHASWQYEIAALMSQIGCVTLPGDVLNKMYSGVILSDDERVMYEKHPEVGARLLEKIPRLEAVTRMIALQLLSYDQYTEELVANEDEEVIQGAQLLKAVIDFDFQLFRGVNRAEAIKSLQKQKGRYNPAYLEALAKIKMDSEVRIISVKVHDLSVGMIPIDDVVAKNGALIIPRGQAITWSLLQGLNNFVRQIGVVEPIAVQVGRKEE
ncbi:HD domain-containing phosphohydrolase [Desulforhopalus sp. IMCC35007]|uniref:HD domain-containing phosphohydrolase n=1 Tax=Desulforhopalus sp. IMCC35007 TaxID=2569543 RepID=UPI0010ADBBDA|nr:HD domain-containing phosphohydrolase [Desulforhopalus sp. IMCC35007]TKB06028.1 response regulator [Desulforhopalus sp. IMCC35007]